MLLIANCLLLIFAFLLNHKNRIVNKRFQVWLPLLFAIVMVWGMIIGYQLQNSMGRKSSGNNGINNTSEEVLELIKEKYVDKANMDSLNLAAIDAMLDKLDPHTTYIPAQRLGDVNDGLRGSMQGGLGIEFQLFADTINIVYVIDKGPAAEAGLQTGDQVIKIGDSTVAGHRKTTDEIRKMLRGNGGTTIDLTTLRNSKTQTITIKRGLIPIPSVDAAFIAAPGVGYIRLNKFAETTYKEFMQAMDKLKQQGMTKLILDLRDNGGGVLDAAVNIADELLEDGRLIVYTEGDKIKRKDYNSTKPGVFEQGPLVVLMNEMSASASEVLAGALQDNDRGTIIGHRSFGKGLVQEQYVLSDGGALRITIARYYTPLGRSIQKSYAQGRKIYQDEVFERFYHSDSTYNDSLYTKGKLYKTANGKIVYGGGGIAPEIYVAYDTANYSAGAARLFNSSLLSNFTYQFYKQNKTALPAYKTSQAFVTSFNLPQNTWNNLVDFAKKDSVNLPVNDSNLKAESLEKVKALLARQIWRNDGYFEVENANDKTFKKALDVIGKMK